jgi:hypothetical protein
MQLCLFFTFILGSSSVLALDFLFLVLGRGNSFSIFVTSLGFKGSTFEKLIVPNGEIHSTILRLTPVCVGTFTIAGVPLTDQALFLI